MRIAAFNVENMFQRTKVFNQSDAQLAKRISLAAGELNLLFEKPRYSPADVRRMRTLLAQLGLDRAAQNRYALFRDIRGRLFRRTDAGLEFVATGRADWIGWVELRAEPVNAVAIQNTARVIRDASPDVIAVVEVENRHTLRQFSDRVLTQVGGSPYGHVMVIEGNDERGIDVGLMTRDDYPLRLMWSHVHEKTAAGSPLFSRDAPEYEVRTPEGRRIWVIPCHFKSKFGGDDAASRAKRAAQAARVAEIYRRLRDEGNEAVAVLGDLNDTPGSEPLRALLQDTDLQDISVHPLYDRAGLPGIGTFGRGADRDKIDYILLSPALFSGVRAAGVIPRGAWPGEGPKPRWEAYPEVKRLEHAASDHFLLWADIP